MIRFISLVAVSALAAGVPAFAQPVAPMQTAAAALAQDAAASAARLGVSSDQAARDVRLQAASVAQTAAIADRHAERLAGIAVEHDPSFRIVVLLTGDLPVADETLDIAGDPVPVSYRIGAGATRTAVVGAIVAHQAAIRASLLRPPGLGLDQRTGELVAMVSASDVAREGFTALHDRLAALTHVPVRLRVVERPAYDMGLAEGGSRLVGQRPGDPRRYLCTAGFVVTDGSRTGIATAAHCPDALSARTADGGDQPLAFVGQWGWGNQDVQINASPDALAPAFFADTARTVRRPVEAALGRAAMRAGDVVCHRGERTGYSCSQVELTDFAPAGDLCGGACLPTWTTVSGPACQGGDSGGPVSLGTTALGIMKGGTYRPDGSCAFYFFMSTDYLPSGWRLLMADPPVPPVDHDGVETP